MTTKPPLTPERIAEIRQANIQQPDCDVTDLLADREQWIWLVNELLGTGRFCFYPQSLNEKCKCAGCVVRGQSQAALAASGGK